MSKAVSKSKSKSPNKVVKKSTAAAAAAAAGSPAKPRGVCIHFVEMTRDMLTYGWKWNRAQGGEEGGRERGRCAGRVCREDGEED